MSSKYFPHDRIVAQITEEFTKFLVQHDPKMADIKLPPINKTKDTSKGDFTVILKAACARLKLDVNKYTTELVEALNTFLEVRKLMIK